MSLEFTSTDIDIVREELFERAFMHR